MGQLKLYRSAGPNPRVVVMFALEKGLNLEIVEVDMISGENRLDAFLKINPAGTLPALALGDGTIIGDIAAICEYLEEKFPEPNLLGKTAEERAVTRMWSRRVDLKITEPLAFAVHSGEAFELFKGRMRLFPYAVEDLYSYANDGLRWIDAQIKGRNFIAGDRISVADINLFGHIDYYQHSGRPIPADCANLLAWHNRMSARASAAASLHPMEAAMRGQ